MYWRACNASPIAIVKSLLIRMSLEPAALVCRKGIGLKLTAIMKDDAAQWLLKGSLMLVIASLGACVTINIYFPAAAAEKAADKVIDEIWQTPAGASAPADSKPSVPAGSPVMPSATSVTPAVNPSVKQEPAP